MLLFVNSYSSRCESVIALAMEINKTHQRIQIIKLDSKKDIDFARNGKGFSIKGVPSIMFISPSVPDTPIVLAGVSECLGYLKNILHMDDFGKGATTMLNHKLSATSSVQINETSDEIPDYLESGNDDIPEFVQSSNSDKQKAEFHPSGYRKMNFDIPKSSGDKVDVQKMISMQSPFS